MQDKTCDHRCHKSHNSSNLEELEVWSNRIDNSEGKTWSILIAALSQIGKFFFMSIFLNLQLIWVQSEPLKKRQCHQLTIQIEIISIISSGLLPKNQEFYESVQYQIETNLRWYTSFTSRKIFFSFFFLRNHVEMNFCVLANQIVRIGRKTHT